MSKFNDIVSAAARDLLPLDPSGHRIENEDDRSSLIFYGNIMIRIMMDPRDGEISSSMTFVDAGEHKEEMPTRIIQRIIGQLSDRRDFQSEDIELLVSNEVKIINLIIFEIADKGYSSRDLLYFYLGYNAAYTDYG